MGKKKKSANRIKRVITKPPHTDRVRWGRFFAHSPRADWWRGFVPCLLVAFMLRCGVGLAGDWVTRPDEVFQYLEQGHRLVFGYGQVPWEFSIGARTWLLPLFSALPMFLCKILGLGHPDFYIPAVKIWHALLSLSLPMGMYLFGRRVIGEKPARLALLLGCFWHEFIILSTHAFAEQYATVVFFSALVLLSSGASAARLLLAGFLLGLTVSLRLHYAPLIGVCGFALIAAYPLRRWYLIFVGGAVAFMFWGAVEFFIWGRWWHSPRLYLDMFFFNDLLAFFTSGQVKFPFYQHLLFLVDSSYGLYVLAIGALFWWRRNWLLISMSATVLILHFVLVSREYTNIFVLLPLLWMLIASVAGNFRGSAIRYAMFGIVVLATSASIASFAAGVPNPAKSYNLYTPKLTPRRDGLFRSEELFKIARDFARIPAGEVRSSLWIPVLFYSDGGYYHSHHRVPMLFPNRNPEHKALYESRPVNTLASHIIAPKGALPSGFSLKHSYERFAMFVNNTPEAVQVSANFTTDFGWPFDGFVIAKARNLQIEFPEPKRVLLNNKGKSATEK